MNDMALAPKEDHSTLESSIDGWDSRECPVHWNVLVPSGDAHGRLWPFVSFELVAFF